MKVKNKILVGILALNLSFAGFGASLYTNPSYAAETTTEKQRTELQRALDDEVNVVNSEVYFNYASQPLKAAYEEALEYGKAIMAKGADATSKELRDATNRINTAKKNIYAEAERVVQKRILERAIMQNEVKAELTRDMLRKYPRTVSAIRPELERLLVESEQLIAEARAILATL